MPFTASLVIDGHGDKFNAATLVPTAKGQGAITLSKSSVRRYGDAANVLSATTNGSYSFTAALPAPSLLGVQSMNGSQNGLYTVFLKILSSQNSPVTNATVILKPVSGKEQQQGTTDATGTLRFSNLQAGIYDATVMPSRKLCNDEW